MSHPNLEMLRVAVANACKLLGWDVSRVKVDDQIIPREITLASNADAPVTLAVDVPFIATGLYGSSYLSDPADYEAKVSLKASAPGGAIWIGDSSFGLRLPLITERDDGIHFVSPRLILPGETHKIVATSAALTGTGTVLLGFPGVYIRQS